MMIAVNKPPLRPREKLLRFGAHSLSDAELLAIFLRTGTKKHNVLQISNNLLTEFGSIYTLINTSLQDLRTQHGIGIAKYTQLQAIVEISHRYLKEKLISENTLTNPTLTRQYLACRLSDLDRELFIVLFLDYQHKVICAEELFVGTHNSVEIHPREIIRQALKYNAAALILAHNHPSGYAEPSEADKSITAKIAQACQLIDIRVIDHIIIGKGEYVSFAERGLI